ncbi:MAG: hypothetical protein CM1200mP34_1780 [Verrucomicrobiales bacterium]|nr:MAG: hypothetical protein CM1200mP34_1780 [Verrucomicrobiales bacterium]
MLQVQRRRPRDKPGKVPSASRLASNRPRLRSTGNGEAGVHGGKPGDLYVVLHVKGNMRFRTGRR